MSKLKLLQFTVIMVMAIAGKKADADVPDAQITKCAAVVSNAERLKCFDALAETVSTAAQVAVQRREAAAIAARQEAAAAAEAAKLEAAQAEARRIQAFGATREDPDELSEIEAKVGAVQALARGFQQVTLDNGQVWRQADGSLLTIRVGDEVMLKRGALGSFRMTVKAQRRTVSVKRIK